MLQKTYDLDKKNILNQKVIKDFCNKMFYIIKIKI